MSEDRKMPGTPEPPGDTASSPPASELAAQEAARREAELAAYNAEVRRRMARRTRRSFLAGGVAALAGLAGFRWLLTRRLEGGTPWPFRRVLDVNGELVRDAFFSAGHRTPELSPGEVVEDRVNGDLGLEKEMDLDAWRLRVEGIAGAEGPLVLALDALRKLPRVEMTSELKCIEGWSVAVRWAGARFRDFVRAYPPLTAGDEPEAATAPEDLPPYVSLETPDGGYYVGLDTASAIHPQTLLAYEMNGAPLTQEHGAPLRLVIPVKYGVKNLKRIGRIRFSASRPPDYWAERGYDWYLGL